tara:strand:+ start:17 stop:619 length:603 start_codon:yes stop_codon:yes gene_type:complete
MALTRLGLNQAVNLASNVTGTLATGNGGTGATSFAPGKIGQVIQTHFNTNTAYDFGANTYGELTEFRTSITPSATSSKVLINVNMCFGFESDSMPIFKMQRDSTDLPVGNTYGSYSPSARQGMFTNYYRASNEDLGVMLASFSYLDSPSSTSSLQYEIHGNNRGSNNKDIRLNAPHSYSNWGDNNSSGHTSSMILMEVLA